MAGTGNAITLDATSQTVGGVNVAAGTGGKGIDIQAGSPAGTLILTSTDSSGSTVALTATSGLLVIDAPIQLGNGSSGSFTATFNNTTNTSSSFLVNNTLTAASGQTWGVNITGGGSSNELVTFETVAKAYNGDTTIQSGGQLRVLNTDNLLPHGAGAGNVIINSGGTLNLNVASLQINGLSGGGAITKTTSNSKTLTVGDNNANGNYTGTISMSGGSGNAVTKIGSGTQVFGGTITTNNFNVNVGTAQLNSTLTATAVTVAANAILGGTGTATLTGAFNVNGTIAPGDSPGVLNVSSLTAPFSSTGGLSIEIAGNTPGNTSSNYDQLNFTNASGSVALNSSSVLGLSVINGFVPSPSDVYYIMSRADSGAFSTLFNGTSEGGTVNIGGGYTGQITYLANWTGTQGGSSLTGGNDVAIYNVQPVPEPASVVLLAISGLTLLGGYRRRAVRG
ncbi:MAG TPA: PEP-CTERM sorting domain-containing protein [Pirellulales bacterium]|nr:PEP-CTERM sorting domain-containing protein [Pirellulales bacterium]